MCYNEPTLLETKDDMPDANHPRTKLNRKSIEQAFDLVGKKAGEREIEIEIAVFGGSCLILASDIREASGDVDAVINERSRKTAYEIIDEVATELGLPQRWLNEGVKRSAPPKGEPAPPLNFFGDYPRDNSGPAGLKVFLPTPEYMLAMKLLANRGGGLDEKGKTQTDNDDVLGLMRLTGITSQDDLVGLMEGFYPNMMAMKAPPLTARLNAKIRNLVDAHRQSTDARVPTWNARRRRDDDDGRGR